MLLNFVFVWLFFDVLLVWVDYLVVNEIEVELLIGIVVGDDVLVVCVVEVLCVKGVGNVFVMFGVCGVCWCGSVGSGCYLVIVVVVVDMIVVGDMFVGGFVVV